MTAPINSRDIILQVTSEASRGTQVYTWDNIINKPSSGGDQVITDSEFPKGTLDGWRPWSGTAAISVQVATATGVPSGATSRYVCRFATPSPTGIVSMFAARKANTDVGSEQEGFPVTVGQQWYVNIRAAKDASFTASYFSINAYFYNKDATISSQTVLSMYSSLGTSWADFGTSFTVPANAVRCWLYVTSSITAGNVFWSQLRCNRKSDSNYYVDGSITAKSLFLTGKGAELNLDFQCKDASAWTLLSGTAFSIETGITDNAITGGSYALRNTNGSSANVFCNEFIPLDQAKNYKLGLAMKQQSSTTANCYLAIAWYDTSFNLLTASVLNPSGWASHGTYSYWRGHSAPFVPTTSFARYESSFGPSETAKSPTAAAYFRVGFRLNFNNTANGLFKVSGVSVQEKADASLVVDGSITATKISVTSLSAINAALGTITAGSITLPASSASHVKAGKTSYAHTAAGFYLGYDSSAYKFSIGDSSKSFSWDGSNLSLANASINTGTTGAIYGGKTSYSDSTAGYFIGYDSGVYKLKIGTTSSGSLVWDGTSLSYPTGSVGTLNLATQAVTIPTISYGSANTDIGTTNTAVISTTFNPEGGEIIGQLVLVATPKSGSVDSFGQCAVEIDGVAVTTVRFGVQTSGANTVYKQSVVVPFTSSGQYGGSTSVSLIGYVKAVTNPGGGLSNVAVDDITISYLKGKR